MVSSQNDPADLMPGDAEAQQVLSELTAAGGENAPQIDLDTMQQRLEDLLSKEKFQGDPFIQQHMNAQMYISFTVLVRHPTLTQLGDSAAMLAMMKEAAQRSEKVGTDEEGLLVRPLLKPRRNTLILRDLPADVPEDDLKALFQNSPESESFCSLKPDVNNTAFVVFTTDEAAQNAALWLRSQKLKGAEIKCAVKSENFVRSFFPATGTPTMQVAQSPYTSYNQAWGFPPWMPVQQGWGAPSESPQHFTDPSMGWSDAGTGWMPDGSGQGFQKGADGTKGKSPKGKGKGNRKRGALGGSFSGMESDMTGSDFNSPVLPSAGGAEGDGFQEGLAEPGYTHEFRKYSRQYIIEVCNAMEDIVKPESYDKCEKNEVMLFRSSPCKDWAPLPTPMTTFAANFFDDRRGSKDGGEQEDEEGKGKGKRKASWGPKGSTRGTRAETEHLEESVDWGQGDSGWWNSDHKTRSNSWFDGQTWDATSWGEGKGAGYGQQKWVKKEADNEQEADKDDAAGPRKMSWAEKVKAGDSSDRGQKWKPKAGDEGKNKESDDKDAGAEVARGPAAESLAAKSGAEAAPGAGAAPEAASETATGASASPTWADKVRSSATKK